MKIYLQGWEDIMKLSVDFQETFETIPDDIEYHLEEWQEVSRVVCTRVVVQC